MKKFLTFLTLFLMLGGVASAEFIELNRCVYGSIWNHEKNTYFRPGEFKVTNDLYEKFNTVYYKESKVVKKRVHPEIPYYYDDERWSFKNFGDLSKNEFKKYILDTKLTKFKMRDLEVYSIDTSNGIVTYLREMNDEYLRMINNRKYREKKLNEDKGFYIKGSSLKRLFLPQPKIELEKYKIKDYAGGVIIATSIEDRSYILADRWALQINLNNKTIKSGHYKYLFQENWMGSDIDGTCMNAKDSKRGERGSGTSSGTAFFITRDGYLLTNNHVVKGCSISKLSYRNKDYDTKLIATDANLDLALLKADIRPDTFIEFSSSDPKKLQKIFVAGYPLGKGLSDDLKITSGIVSSLKGFKDNSNEIQVDAAINPGNSGGPIVNENGELVAIAVSGLSKKSTESINFGIKADAASTFLKLNKVNPSISRFNFSSNSDKLLKILEESTVYTYCNK